MSRKRFVTLNGIRKSLDEWALELDVTKTALTNRLKTGYQIDGTPSVVREGTAVCSECQDVKIRVYSGKRAKSRLIYCDASMRPWYGLLCPDCRFHKKKTTAPLTKRKCAVDRGGCGKALDATRYFLCLECTPELPEDSGDEVYIVW